MSESLTVVRTYYRSMRPRENPLEYILEFLSEIPEAAADEVREHQETTRNIYSELAVRGSVSMNTFLAACGVIGSESRVKGSEFEG